MELLQLTYFCSAAETESFAKTAKKFGVPAQGVSQCVRRLEKELGVTLFDRSANKIMLNKCGKMFYDVTKSVMDKLDEAKKQVGNI